MTGQALTLGSKFLKQSVAENNHPLCCWPTVDNYILTLWPKFQVPSSHFLSSMTCSMNITHKNVKCLDLWLQNISTPIYVQCYDMSCSKVLSSQMLFYFVWPEYSTWATSMQNLLSLWVMTRRKKLNSSTEPQPDQNNLGWSDLHYVFQWASHRVCGNMGSTQGAKTLFNSVQPPGHIVCLLPDSGLALAILYCYTLYTVFLLTLARGYGALTKFKS